MSGTLGNGILMAGLGGPVASPSVKALQTALRGLAVLVNNPALGVTADGIIGPKTTAATNIALSKYVTSANAAQKKGNLTQTQVLNNAAALATLVSQEIPKRQAKQLPVQANAAASQTAIDKAKTAGGVTAQAAQKLAVTRLQKALAALGVATGNATLKAVKADGVMGPKTMEATNLAFARFVAVPAGATLPLSQAQINTKAAAIAALIEGANSASNAKALAARVAAANAQVTANNIKAKTSPAVNAQLDKNVFKALQEGLNTLFAAVKNKLRLKVDGLVGPATVNAVNVALKQYIRDASPEMKKGKLDTNAVRSTGVALVSLIRSEIESRKAKRAEVSTAANAAKENLPAVAVEKIQDTYADAQAGDIDAQQSVREVLEATTSPDPEIQKAATDATAIMREEAESEPAPDDWEAHAIDTGYDDTTPERIDELYLIDEAELSDSELGAHLALAGEMGWNPYKAAKKGVKAAAKGVSKGANAAGRGLQKGVNTGVRGVKEGAKLAVKVTLLPLQIQKLILERYALPIAKGICAVPPVILNPIAISQGINPAHLALFCEAARTGITSNVKKYLPLALKIAVALAANGTLGPGATAALLAVKRIPGIGMVPGLKFLAGDLGCGSCGSDLGCY